MTPRCPVCGQFVSSLRPHDHRALTAKEFVEMVRETMMDEVRTIFSERAPLFDVLRRKR